VVFSLFLPFRVVLGLWNDTVTECPLNELQSPDNLTLRTEKAYISPKVFDLVVDKV
jgi:hypothetical protein